MVMRVCVREARSHLAEILDRVEQGECVEIVRRDRVSYLSKTPPPPRLRYRPLPDLSTVRALSSRKKVSGNTVAEMRNEERG
jgi:antitoxin (DNA-binding transcriptional repressor) of toxin-antitoxin stability system